MVMYCQLYSVWYYSWVLYVGYMSQCLYCRKVLVLCGILSSLLWFLCLHSGKAYSRIWLEHPLGKYWYILKAKVNSDEHTRTHTHTHTYKNVSSLQVFVPWHSMKVILKGDTIFLPNCIQKRQTQRANLAFNLLRRCALRS